MKSRIFKTLSSLAGRDCSDQIEVCERIKTPEDLMQFRDQSLAKLISIAYEKVPYYRRLFDNFHLVEGGEIRLDKFGSLPILTKEIIRNNSQGLIASDHTRRGSYHDISGGSTGEPLQLLHDREYNCWCDATFLHWYRHFLDTDEIKAKKIILWGSLRDLYHSSSGWKTRLANWSRNTIFLNTFQMNEDTVSRYIKTINKSKPEMIRGYASSLYELSKFAQNNCIRLYSPRLIVSSAETLTNEMRAVIETTFNRKVFDFYGSREVSSLAGQCTEGLYHILAINNYVEVLDEFNNPVEPGQSGRIVVTNLHNFSMPLIRYEIGDRATLGPTLCKCGSALPTLKTVNGRISEYLYTQNGGLIYPHVITMGLAALDWVKSFHVVQEDYTKIKICIVPDGVVKQDEKLEIENKLMFLLGPDCEIVWEFISEIPLTPQGKRRYVTSMVSSSGVPSKISLPHLVGEGNYCALVRSVGQVLNDPEMRK